MQSLSSYLCLRAGSSRALLRNHGACVENINIAEIDFEYVASKTIQERTIKFDINHLLFFFHLLIRIEPSIFLLLISILLYKTLANFNFFHSISNHLIHIRD